MWQDCLAYDVLEHVKGRSEQSFFDEQELSPDFSRNRGWANSSWEDPEKVIGRDRRQARAEKRGVSFLLLHATPTMGYDEGHIRIANKKEHRSLTLGVV